MAGPLGEMFDHGKARTPTRLPIQSREDIFSADLMVVIIAGCDAMNTTVRISLRKSASRPSGLDLRQSYREQRANSVWPCCCLVCWFLN